MDPQVSDVLAHITKQLESITERMDKLEREREASPERGRKRPRNQHYERHGSPDPDGRYTKSIKVETPLMEV